MSAISKAAPRPSATRTSCMPRWSSWSRSTSAEIKYSTVQNWYPGDEEGKGGIYNFVTKRGDCRGAQLEDLVDAGRDRLGDHLEISELHPARRRFGRRILFHRHHQPLSAGRHRHEDDPSGQEHALADHLQGHQRRPRAEHLSRARQRASEGRERAQLHAVRLAADRPPMRRAHRALYRKPQSVGAHRARGDDVEDRRRPAVLLHLARHPDRKKRWR